MPAQYICTNCHYIGLGRKAGSGLLEFIGWISFVLPGMAYRSWRNKHKHSVCPKCYERKMIPTDTPVGRELAAKYNFHEPGVQSEPLFQPPSINMVHAAASSILDHSNTKKAKSALKSLLGWALQIIAFLLFLLSTFGVYQQSIGLALGFVILAPLALPPVRHRMPKPVNDGRLVFVIMAAYAFWAPAAAMDIAQQNKKIKTAQQQLAIIDKQVAAFRDNPEQVIKEIRDLIAAKKYQDAQWETKNLLSTNDPVILELHEKAAEGYAQTLETEKKAQVKAEQEVQRIQSEKRSAELRALGQCKHEMARFLNADGAGVIPDVQNHGSGNEFVYAWPRGLVVISSTYGKAGMSASCDGSLKPLKVMSLSINGRTVILNGRRVFE